jgi:hypothetical protein
MLDPVCRRTCQGEGENIGSVPAVSRKFVCANSSSWGPEEAWRLMTEGIH